MFIAARRVDTCSHTPSQRVRMMVRERSMMRGSPAAVARVHCVHEDQLDVGFDAWYVQFQRSESFA